MLRVATLVGKVMAVRVLAPLLPYWKNAPSPMSRLVALWGKWMLARVVGPV